MTSAPLLTGDEAPPIALDGTSRPILTRNNSSPTRPGFDPNTNLSLRLTKVIGTTTVSPYGFDFNRERSSFVTCAGSVAVWNEVDADLNVSQRFFRAHPSVTPQQPLFEPGTPTHPGRRKSQLSPIRAGTLSARGAPAPASPSAPGTPGKSGARQGSRAAACVSISQDGRVLAVGEVGYNPQIYLFSTIGESTAPLSIISEHSFGVRCLTLSSDARWLASLGDVHDGYIYVWAVGTRIAAPKLHGSNKCTATINSMTWMGKSIVTVGVRHVKVWRPDLSNIPSPVKSKWKAEAKESASTSPALNGRNCLLGSLLDSDFTCIAAISDTMAVIGTDRGDVCLLDDKSGNQTLTTVRKEPFAIACISADRENKEVWIGATNGHILCISFAELETPVSTKTPTGSENDAISVESLNDQADITGLGLMNHCLVAIDSARCLRLLRRNAANTWETPLRIIPSHQRPVLGAFLVSADRTDIGFMTYDIAGDVMLWTGEGVYQATYNIPLEQLPYGEGLEPNELTIAKLSMSSKFVAAGDKYGVLRIITRTPWTSGAAVRAHQGVLNDITVCQLDDGTELVASCGRDRAVQLYTYLDEELCLFQTIDQHASSVSSVLFHGKGKFLFSASMDRTIGIHALAKVRDSRAYLALRILTLKQTPLSLALGVQEDCILVTTIDKQLYTFDVKTGQCLSSVKTTDDKPTNAVLMSSIVNRTYEVAASTKNVAIGASATDKSIRVHDTESGSSLTREYGHSESVSGIEVIAENGEEGSKMFRVATTGLDGTIMLWELRNSPRIFDQSVNSSPILESPATAHPLRRVLSKSAFADFSRSLEADGISPISPIPPSTPSRGSSPTRARHRLSTVASPTASPKLVAPRLRRVERSRSPSSPRTPMKMPRRLAIRARSVENFNNLNSKAEGLCQSLKDFQKLAAGSDSLSKDIMCDLEAQLNATLEVIGKNRSQSRSTSGHGQVGELLDNYANRLVRLVEEKVSSSHRGQTHK